MMSGECPADRSAKMIEVSTFVIPRSSDYRCNWLHLAGFIYLKPEMIICAMMCPCICVQMWMSAWWLTCARASCAWTSQDLTPAGAVNLVCNCLRTVTAARVKPHLCSPTCSGKFIPLIVQVLPVFKIACYSRPLLEWTALDRDHDYRTSLQYSLICHDMIYEINAVKRPLWRMRGV